MSSAPQTTADPLGASLFEASEDCVKLISPAGALEEMNVNGLCLMEIDNFDLVRGQAWDTLWPEAERPKILAAVAQANAGQVARFAADCPTAKGAMKSWEIVVSPVLDEAGRTVRIASISRDVTERVRAAEENALLARELSHRIKNMFAVVDGMIAMSARGAGAAAPFADALRQRLSGLGRAMAYVAPRLPGARRPAGDRTLLGLLQELLGPFGAEDGLAPPISLSGEDVPIGQSATTAVALLFNELATNALKYGALSRAAGQVRVEIRRDGDHVKIDWREHAPDLEIAPQSEAGGGFGVTLMDNAVRRHLDGSLTRTRTREGLVVEVRVPTDRLAD